MPRCDGTRAERPGEAIDRVGWGKGALVNSSVSADAAGCGYVAPGSRARVRTPDSKKRRLSRVANIKSQIKRIKTNEKARQRNAAVRSSLKTSVRKFRTAADSGDAGTATEELLKASRQLDKAASKGVIHKNQAANRKSAMAKKVASL